MMPKGWTTGIFGDGIELISGQHVDAKNVNSLGQGKPYLTGPADFKNGKIEATKYTTTGKSFCITNDLLITVKGSGTGKIVRADREYAISRQLMAVRPTKFDAAFTFYTLLAETLRYENSATGLIPGISRSDIIQTPVLIPTIYEQTKIAQILSTWDKAIATTERLLANSQQQKQALMQHLLTGKKRLRGFSQNWRRASVASCLLGSSLRNTDSRLGVEDVMSVNKTEGMIPMREQTIGKSIDRYKIVKPGWFAYNPMRINVGSICRWHKETDCLVSPDYVVFECSEEVLFGAYFDHFRKSESWTSYMENAGNGSVRVRIYLTDLSQLEIPLPSLPEQQKIAKVLSTADGEIAHLQAQLDKLKLEKKALMQQLLTGKRRVRLDDEEEDLAPIRRVG